MYFFVCFLHWYLYFIVLETAVIYLEMVDNELRLKKEFDSNMVKSFKVRNLILRIKQNIF